MTEIEKKHNYKIILIGDGGVGKTSIRTRFLGKGFKSTYMETVGADYGIKEMNIDTSEKITKVSFHIWDLAGQPKFEKIRKLYYQNVQGIVFVFDISRLDSLENIKVWVQEVLKNGLEQLPVLLIGNKYDLLESDTVICCDERDDAQLAKFIFTNLNKNKVPVHKIRTSAKTGYNVEESFYLLAREIYENPSSS